MAIGAAPWRRRRGRARKSTKQRCRPENCWSARRRTQRQLPVRRLSAMRQAGITYQLSPNTLVGKSSPSRGAARSSRAELDNVCRHATAAASARVPRLRGPVKLHRRWGFKGEAQVLQKIHGRDRREQTRLRQLLGTFSCQPCQRQQKCTTLLLDGGQISRVEPHARPPLVCREDVRAARRRRGDGRRDNNVAARSGAGRCMARPYTPTATAPRSPDAMPRSAPYIATSTTAAPRSTAQ